MIELQKDEPIPTASVRLRRDLVFSQQAGPEGEVWVVKDPARRKYFRFRAAEHFILRQLEAGSDLDEVRRRAEAQFGHALPPEHLQGFIDRLGQLGLLDVGEEPTASREPGRVGGDLFYLRLRAFDPDRFLTLLADRLGFLFTRSFVAVSAMLILAALVLTVGNWAAITDEFGTLLRFESLLLAWVVILIVIVFHEIAHGLTCKHFGGGVHEMGFMLIYFQPAFYCNVSDAWLFPEKYQRLWVTLAGAYFELFLWAISTFVWRVTEPYTAPHRLALIVVATSAVKSMFNLNPLIKLDGYYLLSDFLDAPNLRQRASEYLRARIGAIFGWPARWMSEVSRRERRIYLAYGMASTAFSAWLLPVVLLGFGRYMVGQYQAWGFVLFGALVGGLFRSSIAKASRAAASMLKRKPVKIVLALALAAVVLFVTRMELRVAGEFVVLPIHNTDVRAEVDGIVQEILVDEGQTVRRGEPIARLSDFDRRAELRKTQAEIEETQARLRLLRAGPRTEEIELARTGVAKAEERLKFARGELSMDREMFDQKLLSLKDLERTRETATVREKELEESRTHLKDVLAGTRPEDIEAIEAELKRLEAQQRYLEDQTRLLSILSPVDGVVATHKPKEMIGQHVNEGDLIAKVLELKTVTAEIAVSENEISEVTIGQPVELKLRAYPELRFHGTVKAVAPIAHKPEDVRASRTISVTTQLDNEGLLLKPEMSGNARILCGKRRLLDLVTRRFARYLRVEFWSWW